MVGSLPGNSLVKDANANPNKPLTWTLKYAWSTTATWASLTVTLAMVVFPAEFASQNARAVADVEVHVLDLTSRKIATELGADVAVALL